MRTALSLVLATGLAFAASPAAAQLTVHDPVSYASLLRQATTALDQLNELRSQVAEAKKLYDGFNTASGAGGFASLLKAPELRAFVPDADKYLAAARGDLSALGEIGQKATALRANARLHTARPDDVRGQDLERSGDRAARDLALGQATVKAGAERLRGLEDLLAAIDTAPNARAVMDLQARLSVEQVMSLNDQMRLQGLAMTQDAEARLQAQRDRERASAARQTRMQRYQAGFQ
jgi:type IV secretion system protein VirB5